MSLFQVSVPEDNLGRGEHCVHITLIVHLHLVFVCLISCSVACMVGRVSDLGHLLSLLKEPEAVSTNLSN